MIVRVCWVSWESAWQHEALNTGHRLFPIAKPPAALSPEQGALGPQSNLATHQLCNSRAIT